MWDESKCNRDDKGRFAEKGSGGYSKEQLDRAKQRFKEKLKREKENKSFIDIQLFAVDYRKMKTRELQKSKNSFNKRIAEH